MDAEEIARLVMDLRVSDDIGNKAIMITNEEVEKGQKRLERVVVGKIFSRKAANRETLRANLPKILRVRGSTEIELVGHNLFVISFALESDKKVALEEGPWHFFQDLMILKQTKPMQTPMEVEFKDITMWVQCHNVPFECMDPSIIKRIGGQVGEVEEVDVGEGGLCVGKYARVRVTRPIDEPLVRCVPIKQEGMEKEVIIVLQYERLPEFCFTCGRVGHISRDCVEKVSAGQKPSFDSWLRAGRSYVGRRGAETGSRWGPRGSPQREAGNRCLELRSGGEEVGGVRETDVEVGNWREGDKGRLVVRGVTREEGLSSEGSLEANMEVEEVVALTSEREEEVSLERISPKASKAGGNKGEARWMEKKKSEVMNLSSGKSPQKNKRRGGKGWKRLARERKEEGSKYETVDGKEGKCIGALRGREEDTEGGEEEEGCTHKQKQLRISEEGAANESTAVAAKQPRRSL